MVEFQPSGWEKGSYLNVAAHWLWNANEGVSFDFGTLEDGIRVAGFIRYVSDEQFRPEAVQLAYSAADAVERLRSRFKTVDDIAAILCDNEEALPTDRRGSWGAYNAGVALGLTGQLQAAKAMFASIDDERVRPAAEALQRNLGNEAEFSQYVNSLIVRKRSALGIDPKV